MVDTFLDMAADSPVPVLSGTHTILGRLKEKTCFTSPPALFFEDSSIFFLYYKLSSVTYSKKKKKTCCSYLHGQNCFDLYSHKPDQCCFNQVNPSVYT